MKFEKTPLEGAYIIRQEPRGDDRGMFARAFCVEEFMAAGLDPRIAQMNHSSSKSAGTLRGLHYQDAPCGEVKVVRCVRGSFDDVIVDVRPDSPTYLQHFKIRLTAENKLALYVPKGFAHGYLTLEDDTEAFYSSSFPYANKFERGIRWNDPLLNIDWGISDPILSEADANRADFVRA